MDSKLKRIIFIMLRIAASLFIAYVFYIIWAIIAEDMYYDNYYGPLDYLGASWNGSHTIAIICIGIYIITLFFIWKLLKLKWRLIVTGSIFIFVICCGIFYVYQKDMLEIRALGESGDEINLRDYEPFCENTLAKSLDEESSLILQNHLPRMDGATALYPLYSAFARATYPEAVYFVYGENSAVDCSRTSGAFNSLLKGTADVIFLMGISDEQRKQADELGLELTLTPIGKEGFVFFVNKANSMKNLSVENIKGIYSGKIKNWHELGAGNREILAYQRPEASGSQIMLREIMGDTPIVEVPEKDNYYLMMDMYKAVAYKNHKNALGYSFLFYIRDMIAENKIKFLSIDGVEPVAANIASGDYPFAHDFYAITATRQYTTDDEKARADNTQKLIEWILSSQGQSLVEKTGYVPLS